MLNFSFYSEDQSKCSPLFFYLLIDIRGLGFHLPSEIKHRAIPVHVHEYNHENVAVSVYLLECRLRFMVITL
jgi:hypothetical protein